MAFTRKPPVRVLATANVALTGSGPVDGLDLVDGERVLLTGQTSAPQNGIWLVHAGAWTRPSDFASASSQSGCDVLVKDGSHAGEIWAMSGTVTVDSTAETWTALAQTAESSGTAAGASQQLVPTPVKTANYTAAAGDLVPCDITAASLTVTLPTAPPDESRVAVKVVGFGAGHTVTIAAGAGDAFNATGGATTEVLSAANQALALQYSAGPKVWYVVDADAGAIA